MNEKLDSLRDKGLEQIKDPIILFGILVNSLRSVEERLTEIQETIEVQNQILCRVHGLDFNDFC